MADRMSNIEMLLMLSDDVRAQGDDLAAELRARGTAHAQRVVDLIGMLDKARAMLERERQRFSVYLPEGAQQPTARIQPMKRQEANG